MMNKKINHINLIAYDFDGVMTDNKVYIDEIGKELVHVNRADGLGIQGIKSMGIEQIIISTETNPVVSIRAKKLSIKCFQGIENKKDALIEYCKSNDTMLETVAYVGNDINDEDVMKIVGITFCPADSHLSIKNISDNILNAKGGEGVVREIFDLIKRGKNE